MKRAAILWAMILAAAATGASPVDARTPVHKPASGLSHGEVGLPRATSMKMPETRIVGRPGLVPLAGTSFAGARPFNARMTSLGGPSAHPSAAVIGGSPMPRKHGG